MLAWQEHVKTLRTLELKPDDVLLVFLDRMNTAGNLHFPEEV